MSHSAYSIVLIAKSSVKSSFRAHLINLSNSWWMRSDESCQTPQHSPIEYSFPVSFDEDLIHYSSISPLNSLTITLKSRYSVSNIVKFVAQS